MSEKQGGPVSEQRWWERDIVSFKKERPGKYQFDFDPVLFLAYTCIVVLLLMLLGVSVGVAVHVWRWAL